MSYVPRVGIGMPVYNGERHIRQSIETLLAQTFGDFELVIADNASTDGTGEICREYATRDARVRYVRNPVNVGGPGNFRRVFALCRGEYHKWSTADDFWDPTLVEKCVAVLDADPGVVLAYPRSTLVDADGRPFERHDDHLDLQDPSPTARCTTVLETSTLCHAHLGVIRRDAMRRTALIGRELASDIRFLAELSLYGRFAVVPEYLFFRRFHEGSSSWERDDMARQRAYYAPGRRGRFGLHRWRRLVHLLLAGARAPIGWKERWRLWSYLGRRARWDRRRLGGELLDFIRLRP